MDDHLTMLLLTFVSNLSLSKIYFLKKSFMDLPDSQIKSSVEREYILEVWNRIRIRLKFPKIPATIKHFDVNIQDSSIYTLSKNLYHIYIIFYVGLKTFLTFPSRKSMAPSYSMFHNLINTLKYTFKLLENIYCYKLGYNECHLFISLCEDL